MVKSGRKNVNLWWGSGLLLSGMISGFRAFDNSYMYNIVFFVQEVFPNYPSKICGLQPTNQRIKIPQHQREFIRKWS